MADYPKFCPALLNLEGDILLKGVGLQHPLFAAIKFCQVRSALGCNLKIFTLKIFFLNLIWPKVAYHGMAYFIF
jgi:hypothetical protein